jgi:hypothetical protein
MDVDDFQSSLLEALSDCPFVESVDLKTEAVIVKGRVVLEDERFLQVYFNEHTGTTAFAVIEEERRIWGVDYDSLRGWHVHPVDRPDEHQDVDPMTPSEVVEALEEVWARLP